ncbi:MAG TPA: esterase-like activity of phytase family protein [Cyclobacteriaceae bacterium]|jgi:hypothetical protein|nr:esterase-like activity of phytase family protein [Cyclobacteriaceae bacterium]
MPRFSKSIVFFLLLISSSGHCQTSKGINIRSLKFIGEYDIPFNLIFKETTVGGLSGIDYDKKNDLYYFICDDRSAINPARFYSARIKITEKGIDTIAFQDLKFLLQQNGETYPSAKQDMSHTIDPESLRFDPTKNQIIWTSEGERVVKSNPPILINPSINVSDLGGKFVDTFPIPSILSMQATESGPHQNGGFEGVTFDPDFRTMYVAMEEPLYEDGPLADVTSTKSWTRIFSYDVSTKKNLTQYAYGLEPVAHPATPATAFKINGISEILSLGNKKLLTVERSFSTGNLGCAIKVFIADLGNATHVEKTKSMNETQPKHPVSKKLLFNMDDLRIFIDNIEGVTFGPDLPNGHKTLIFVSDNNFNPLEKMQLLLFEVIP